MAGVPRGTLQNRRGQKAATPIRGGMALQFDGPAPMMFADTAPTATLANTERRTAHLAILVKKGKLPPELGNLALWEQIDGWGFRWSCYRIVGPADARARVMTEICYLQERWEISDVNTVHVLDRVLRRGTPWNRATDETVYLSWRREYKIRTFDHRALLALMHHKLLRAWDGDHAVVGRVAGFLFTALDWPEVHHEECVGV
jgi:hypothetical protein